MLRHNQRSCACFVHTEIALTLEFDSPMTSKLYRFLKSNQGNVAMIFALSMFVIIGVTAAAVDMSKVMSNKSVAQDALDSAVVAAAIVQDNSEENLKKVANTVFASNLKATNIDASITAFKYDPKTRSIKATAVGSYKPYMVQFLGFDSLPYTVMADSIRAADGQLEVALVLDNTWSMSANLADGQQKIAVLKTAAKALIKEIMTEDNKDFVKVAVVPYADYVNVGTGNRSASWMSVIADYSTTSKKTCTTIKTKSVCTGGTIGTCTRYKDGVSENYSCWLVPQTCKTVAITPYESCSGGNTTYFKWYGCTKNQISSSKLVMPDPATAYTGIVQSSQTCLNPILTLSNDKAKVEKTITDLVVNIGGYKPETYIPAGLIWGINAISPPAPFVDPKAYDSKNKEPRKTIVLMTDGANTLYAKNDGTIAVGNATQVGTTYADQLLVCQYAKDKKIEIYTIGFDVTDAKALDTLKKCATDEAHYFDTKSSDSLIKAFGTIGGNLSRVRLTG